MSINDIRVPEDILLFLNENIEYGWIDVNGQKHIKDMKDFRKLYKTMSLDTTINIGLGTCIEQVNLMKYLLDKIEVKSKMYCCRIYEADDYNDLEAEEHMHCFILYYLNNNVYHIEHPNSYNIGIFEYKSEEGALDSIIKYYINLSGGVPRATSEFFEVPVGLTFKEFNSYINSHNNKMK